MRFGSLFAGIGGFDLGLERAGMTVAWQMEWEPYCQAVLAKHWPDVPRYGDIKELDRDGFRDLEPVDLICGGPPCQPSSNAGKQLGAADDRWLWPETVRAVSALRPRWCLFENPTGFVKVGLDGVLSDLEGQGYEVGTFNIPACAVDAPHRRERLWIVAHRNGKQHQGRAQRTVADTKGQSERSRLRQGGPGEERRGRFCHGGGAGDVAHAGRQGLPAPEQKAVQRAGRRFQGGAIAECCRWSPEPGVGRVAHGVPARVDRLRALGNAVVSQVVEEIGRAIMAAEACA